MQEKYGDITVHISKKHESTEEMVPERYATDGDDHLMNMMISKGFATTKEKGASLNIKVECGCNCQCCKGSKKSDFWELSKDCGCDCGCCNMND